MGHISVFLFRIYLVIIQHNQFSAMVSQVIGTTEYRLLLMLLRLRLHLGITIIVDISVEIIRVVDRGRCRHGHGFSHLDRILNGITVIVVVRLQGVWLRGCRNIIVIRRRL